MIGEVTRYINSLGRFNTTKEIIENALWFNISSLIGVLQPRISYNNLALNYFGITIASSSSGKSFSNDKTLELFDIKREVYRDMLLKGYIANDSDVDTDIIIEGNNVKLMNYLPEDISINIEGTTEGLYLRALAISNSFTGSLNIINEEVLDVIKDSSLNKMKELYDGRFNAKVIKGSINQNIYNLNANMLLFGSSIKIKKDIGTYNLFSNALSSGVHRRSYIYYEPPQPIQKKEKHEEVISDNSIAQNVKSFIKNNLSDRLNGKDIVINIDCRDIINDISQELLEFSNEYIYDERYSAEIGSLDRIVKLATYHHIATGSYRVNENDFAYAYDFYKRCRESTKQLFNIEPQHKKIYKILKSTNELSKSEILEKDIFQRNTFNEDLDLVDEICYRNNEVLVQKGNRVKKYKIEPLPPTDISKIIISLSIEQEKGARATKYKSMELPLFGDKQSLESLVVSDKISSFCLVHFENNKRSDKNAIAGQNCIAFDFDDGETTLEDVFSLFKDYKYLIYTTKSHTEDQHRFRLILPTKFMFYVNQEQHAGLIENISNLLGITNYDIATRNISRLWFTNAKAKVFTNQQGEMLDVNCCIPNTKKEEELVRVSEDDVDEITKDKRVQGMLRWTVANATKGSRNISLFKLYKFVCDVGSKEEANEIVYIANSLISEPLSEKEIQTLIRR